MQQFIRKPLSFSLNPTFFSAFCLDLFNITHATMSHRFHSITLLLILATILCSLQIHQTHSSSSSFLLPLSHTLSAATNSSLHHLLKSSTIRSTTRHCHRRGIHRRQPPLSLPLSSGSDYTLSLSVGPASSPTTVSLFMDTGSDIVWFPCSPFECILCEGKPNPNSNTTILPPPPDSHLISCDARACSAAHSHLPSSDLCAAAKCRLDDIETSSCSSHACPPLYYAYGDGSLLAHLRHGRLSLASSKPNSLSISNFTFACAHSTLAEPVGVAGFGRGPLSLPAQLSTLSPSLSSRFSYCLVSHSFHADRLLHPSPLILGRSPEPSTINPAESAFVYTPLLQNPKHPYFYSVALEAISVGPTKIPARPDLASVDHAGNGGMVVDSGTTFTMLPEETFSHVSTEFARHMLSAGFNRAEETEAKTGLIPCYYFNSNRSSNRLVPSLAFHFKSNATVVLPRRNYFLGFKSEGKRVGCLMLMNAGSWSADETDDSGPAGTLGNFQQQGFEVVYDLEEARVGFARRRCTALWDSFARG